MRKIILLMTIVALPALFADIVLGQELIVFPAKGQSQAQMEKDKFECYQWAKGQTGFDPMQAQPSAQAPPPPQSQGPSRERLKGAARGAAVGAVAGEIASDDAGKGALAGAAGGTMIGGMKSRDRKRQQQQADQQQVQQQETTSAQKFSTYNRAYSACLEGKGYTVK